MKISVPYNFDFKLAQKIAEKYSDCVYELYLPASQSLVGSGRPRKEPDNYEKQIPVIIKLMHRHKIKVNMLFNGQCEGLTFYKDRNLCRLLDYIKSYREEFGLDSITVIDTVHLPDIRKYIPDIEIQASVNLMVNNFQKACYLKELGVDVITIDKDMNKNLALIKKIRDITNLKLKILVNDSCLPECPFRIQHVNAVSHVSRLGCEEYRKFGSKIDSIFFSCCGKIYQRSPWLFLKSSFIRPEDIKHYEGIVDYIKVADRMGSTNTILKIVDSYAKGSYKGDLLDLIFVSRLPLKDIGISICNEKIPGDFFEKISKCSRECIDCDYCKTTFKAVSDGKIDK